MVIKIPKKLEMKSLLPAPRSPLPDHVLAFSQHTQKYIKPDMQDQHNRLCKQYKDSETMDEAESRYLAIRAWWLSSRAASEDANRDLNL
jgi:hypothetical protein